MTIETADARVATAKTTGTENSEEPAAATPTTGRRRTVMVLGLLALLGSAIGGYSWWKSRNVGPEWPLVLQGNVEVRQVNLGFKVAGRIEDLVVDEGMNVTEGQRLGSLEKVYFEESLAQMKAQRDQQAANYAKLKAGNRPEDIAQARALVAEREATLANAKITMDRAEQLKMTGAGTIKNYDDALAAQRSADAQLNSARQALHLMEIGPRKEDIDTARAQLEEKEALIQTSQRQLADADLVAPNAGTVLSRVREKGAIVNAGETVYVLSLTSPVWVRTYVAETELPRIKPGMEVEVKTDAAGLPALKGRIGFISTTAEFTPKTVETRELRTALVYRLRIVVEDPNGKLRQGMPMTVSVLKPREGTDAGAQFQ